MRRERVCSLDAHGGRPLVFNEAANERWLHVRVLRLTAPAVPPGFAADCVIRVPANPLGVTHPSRV